MKKTELKYGEDDQPLIKLLSNSDDLSSNGSIMDELEVQMTKPRKFKYRYSSNMKSHYNAHQ